MGSNAARNTDVYPRYGVLSFCSCDYQTCSGYDTIFRAPQLMILNPILHKYKSRPLTIIYVELTEHKEKEGKN